MKTVTEIKRYDRMSVATCNDGSKVRFNNDIPIEVGTNLEGPFEQRTGKYGQEDWAKSHNVVTSRGGGGQQSSGGGGHDSRNASIEAQVILKEACESARVMLNAGLINHDAIVGPLDAFCDSVHKIAMALAGTLAALQAPE